jgi:hypothetical protein
VLLPEEVEERRDEEVGTTGAVEANGSEPISSCTRTKQQTLRRGRLPLHNMQNLYSPTIYSLMTF